MDPSPNRIVTYRNEAGEDWPAIICQLDEANEGYVDLFVFDLTQEHPVREFGVPLSETAKNSTWRWPEVTPKPPEAAPLPEPEDEGDGDGD